MNALSSSQHLCSTIIRNVSDLTGVDSFNKTLIVHLRVIGKVRFDVWIHKFALAGHRADPRSTQQKTVWWRVSCCSSVCVPAAASLMWCAGGVGTVSLHATPTASCDACHGLYRAHWLTARHRSDKIVLFFFSFFFNMTCDIVKSYFQIAQIKLTI